MIRAFFLQTVINTELAFEQLTGQEQVDLIMKLIEDTNLSHPEYKLFLAREDFKTKDSLDF